MGGLRSSNLNKYLITPLTLTGWLSERRSEIDGLVAIIKGIYDAFVEVLKLVRSQAWSFIKSVFDAIYNILKPIIDLLERRICVSVPVPYMAKNAFARMCRIPAVSSFATSFFRVAWAARDAACPSFPLLCISLFASPTTFKLLWRSHLRATHVYSSWRSPPRAPKQM